MPVGMQASQAGMNQSLTNLSTALRDLMSVVNNLVTEVTNGGDGLAYLESIGFGSTADDANPGNISDAQYALNMINYLGTVSGVYFGTATQGSEFDFNSELSVLWAGQ